MRLKTFFAVLPLAATLTSVAAWADTIVLVNGDSSAGKTLFSTDSVAASWTSTTSYFDVNITVELLVNPGTGFPTRTVTAYLTNQIGPGTSAADEVESTVTLPEVTSDFPFQPTVSLFQDITLAPGTYYLTLASNAPDNNSSIAWGVITDGLAIQTGTGVTRNGDLQNYGNAQNAFAPASVFSASPFDNESPLVYAVTGTPLLSTVPEPSSPSLILFGGAAIIVCVKRRSGASADGRQR